MANPRKYLSLFQIFSEMNVENLAVILPHLDQNVREAIYVSIYSVLNSKRLSPELKSEIEALVKDRASDLDFLTGKANSKYKKKRMLESMAAEVQLLLAAANNNDYCSLKI